MNKLAQQLRDQSTEELKAAYIDNSRELFLLKNEMSLNKKVDKPHLFTELKKKSARILTILNQRECALRCDSENHATKK